MRLCKVNNCDKKYYGFGYCNRHYQQLWMYGKILKRTIKDKNEYIDCGDYYEICLYNRQCQEVARALIDKDDYEKVKDYKWSLSKIGYSITENKKRIYLHQLILGKKEGLEIDHINHNKLDNRKQNLWHCTHSQNLMNRKNVKGYSWNKKKKKWEVYIHLNRKKINLGCFTNEQDAIKARRIAKEKYFVLI